MTDAISYELITLIKRLAALVHQNIDMRLKPYGLARTQYAALYQLSSRSHMALGELADILLVEPATLSGIADTLQAKGLIERVGSTADKRRKNLVLTAKGKQVLASIPPPGPVVERVLMQGVTQSEGDIFKQVGNQMIENLKKELKIQEGEKHAAKTKA